MVEVVDRRAAAGRVEEARLVVKAAAGIAFIVAALMAGAAAPRRWPTAAWPRDAASICREPDHVRVDTGATSDATGSRSASHGNRFNDYRIIN